jgi:hypothetical protein
MAGPSDQMGDPMSRLKVNRSGRILAALALALAVAACSSSAATPVIIIVTPSPAATDTSAAATPTPTDTATDMPTDTATATETATDTATPPAAPTDTPSPSATLAPGASPTSRAAMCTGTAANIDFIAAVAHQLSFGVYCAALPSGWWLQSGQYHTSGGGAVTLQYKSSGGYTINLYEENNGSTCVAADLLGPAKFGDLNGQLYYQSHSPLTWGLNARPVVGLCYRAYGTGLSQAKFVAYMAGLKLVPKN